MTPHKTISILLAALAIIVTTVSCKEEVKKDRKAVLQVTSTPEGAQVFVGEKEIGVTPFQTSAPAGTHMLKFIKAKHKPTWVKVTCQPLEKKSVDATLQPIVASVMITTTPPGCAVEMNEKVVGETPLTLHNLPIGKYSAIIKRLGFSQKEVVWEVQDEKPKLITESIETNIGTLVVNSAPEGASVFLNGQPIGKTPVKKNIEPGKYKIRLELAGHSTFEDMIVVERNKQFTQNASLKILPGSLCVTTEPGGAVLFVNEKRYEDTPFTLKNLAPGNYSIRVVKNGFDPETRTAAVHPDQQTNVSIKLSGNAGGIDLVANPPGTTIYLDGKKMGVSEPDDSDKSGELSKVFPIRNLSPGKHNITVAHKRAYPKNKKSVDVNVEKGQITRLSNLSLWIPNFELKLKDGKVLRGRLAEENDKRVFFEIEPGVKQEYKKTEIQALDPLKYEE